MPSHDANQELDPQSDASSAQRLWRELEFNQAELAKCKKETLKFQQQVKELQNTYIEFFDLLPIGFVTLGKKALMLEINQTGAAMLGGTPGDLLGKQFIAWVAENDRPLFLNSFRQALLSRNNPVIELGIETSQGALHRVRMECIVMEAKKAPSCHILMTDLGAHSKVETAALTSGAMEVPPIHSHRIIHPDNRA